MAAAEDQHSIGECIADFILGVDPAAIPVAVRQRAVVLLLDALGVALAASSYEFGRTAAAGLRLLGPGDVPVIGMADRLSLRDAAIVNGILTHGLDYDDVSIHGRVHPSASCASSALTLAGYLRRSGAEMLAAYVAGLETAIRVGAASQGGFQKRGFDPTGVVGAFGSCSVAGRLFGLTRQQMVEAQGIVYSMASGNRAFVSDMRWTKRLHPGWAGAAGITAAALAKGGFRGPEEPYGGATGLYQLYLGNTEGADGLAQSVARLGDVWLLEDVAIKPVPACYFNIAPIDAAIAIAREHRLSLEEIAKVVVLLPEAAVDTVCEPSRLKRRPTDGYSGEFSIYYTVAAALLRGSFGLREHEAASVNDSDIRALMDRIDYQIDPESTFPKYYSGAVVVHTTSGTTLTRRESINRGSRDRPLSALDIDDKFFENAGRVFGRSRCADIRSLILGIERLDDARVLVDRLATASEIEPVTPSTPTLQEQPE